MNKELTKKEKEQWAKWYNHKSNKEKWIEAQEKTQEEEETSEDYPLGGMVEPYDIAMEKEL